MLELRTRRIDSGSHISYWVRITVGVFKRYQFSKTPLPLPLILILEGVVMGGGGAEEKSLKTDILKEAICQLPNSHGM